MSVRAKRKQQKQVRQQQCLEQCIEHIPYYISGLLLAHFFRQLFSKQLYTETARWKANNTDKNPYVSSLKSRHCMNSLKFQFKSNKRWSVYVITLIPYVNLSLFPTVVLLSGLDIFASTVFHGFTYHQFTRMHFVLSFI